MKDEELNLEEIESSHTLDGTGRCTLLSYTLRYVSLTDLDRLPVWVEITDPPVYMR